MPSDRKPSHAFPYLIFALCTLGCGACVSSASQSSGAESGRLVALAVGLGLAAITLPLLVAIQGLHHRDAPWPDRDSAGEFPVAPRHLIEKNRTT
jgi:hypothetical protein